MKHPQTVTDYRPVLNSNASRVIFERTIKGVTELYSLDLTHPDAKPAVFVPYAQIAGVLVATAAPAHPSDSNKKSQESTKSPKTVPARKKQ